MLENINPMLIIAIVGVVIVVGLIFYFKPFGIGAFTNVKERFDGLTALNKKLFEQITPMDTPNVQKDNKIIPDIPSNSANILTNIIFPELNKPVEEKPVEEKPAEPSFVLPEMVAPAEETQSVILPSPILAEVQIPETAEVAETKPFVLPSTILTEDQQTPLEKPMEVPVEMKELEIPVEVQPSFELPSLINTNEQPIVPQNDTSLIASLEEQNKPVDVASIVSEIPSSDVPQNSAELIKQQIEQPVLQQTVATVSGVENGLSNGIVNQFKNTRILGAFPMH